MIHMKQSVIVICGPDMTGKSQITAELSRRTGIPSFKASTEHDTFLSKQELFALQLRHADTRMVDFLKQTGHSVIFDRSFPCEFVYSRVLNRQTDCVALAKVDIAMAALGARVIVCHRSSYDGIVDDLDPSITGDKLRALDTEYKNFVKWTKCKTMMLNVDDEDLEREVNEVMQWLGTP